MDPRPLAEHAAYVIDEVERDYGADTEMLDAVVVVEIRSWPDGEDADPTSTVEVFALGRRNTTAIGILTRGLDALLQPDEEDE
jgi:hypothetical protein